MPRVKGGVHALKKRRNVLRQAKGFRFGRSTKEREARTAILHAGVHAFAHRRDKKNVFRRLWHVKINAALHELGWSLSKFLGALRKKGVSLDKKVLAHLAEHEPKIFAKIVELVRS